MYIYLPLNICLSIRLITFISVSLFVLYMLLIFMYFTMTHLSFFLLPFFHLPHMSLQHILFLMYLPPHPCTLTHLPPLPPHPSFLTSSTSFSLLYLPRFTSFTFSGVSYKGKRSESVYQLTENRYRVQGKCVRE